MPPRSAKASVGHSAEAGPAAPPGLRLRSLLGGAVEASFPDNAGWLWAGDGLPSCLWGAALSSHLLWPLFLLVALRAAWSALPSSAKAAVCVLGLLYLPSYVDGPLTLARLLCARVVAERLGAPRLGAAQRAAVAGCSPLPPLALELGLPSFASRADSTAGRQPEGVRLLAARPHPAVAPWCASGATHAWGDRRFKLRIRAPPGVC